MSYPARVEGLVNRIIESFSLYLFTSPLSQKQDMTQGNFFSWNRAGLKSEFLFSYIGHLNKTKEPSLSFYIPISRRGEKGWFHAFSPNSDHWFHFQHCKVCLLPCYVMRSDYNIESIQEGCWEVLSLTKKRITSLLQLLSLIFLEGLKKLVKWYFKYGEQ